MTLSELKGHFCC